MKSILFIIILFPFYTLSQDDKKNFIGTLKYSENNEPVYLKDSVVFYLHSQDRFIFHNLNGLTSIVFNANGRSGQVSSDKIMIALDQAPFKINYDPDLFPFSADTTVYASNGFFSAYKMMFSFKYLWSDTFNIAAWTRRAYNKDTAAFLALVGRGNYDMEAVGQYAVNNWKIINSWTDMEIATLLIKTNKLNRHRMIYGLINDDGYILSTPFDIKTLILYYKTYYPLTWGFCELDKYKEDKNYNKKLNKLKRETEKRKNPAPNSN